MPESVTLNLPHGHKTVIDAADLPLVAGLRFHRNSEGYARFNISLDGKERQRYLHRLLVGDPPWGLHVDHISGDKLDNRRANLRVVSVQTNMVNQKTLASNNTSGARGVQLVKRRSPWRARIRVDGRDVPLGAFSTFEEAVAARYEAELKYFGEVCPTTAALVGA